MFAKTAGKRCNVGFEGSPTRVRVVGVMSFYEKYEATNLYVERSFDGDASTITISNESASDTVQVSYDGATLEAELEAEESITLRHAGTSSIYIKATTGGEDVRIWSW